MKTHKMFMKSKVRIIILDFLSTYCVPSHMKNFPHIRVITTL